MGKTPGMSAPLQVKRRLKSEAHDFNHYSTLYQNALHKMNGTEADPDQVRLERVCVMFLSVSQFRENRSTMECL